MRTFSFFRMIVLAALAAGCASSPVEHGDLEIDPWGPAHVLSGESGPGDRVVWGGRIVAIENLTDRTELLVASYPLDRADRPRFREDPGVRFVLIEPRFLEPMQYQVGRFVTVLGVVDGVEERATGEHLHAHPVLRSKDLHLWPADTSTWRDRTAFSVGVGIRL